MIVSPYENDALFPIIQAWRPFCPHATDREIRLVVAKVIGELTALPEHADFLPSVPLWAQETITQDSNPNHLPKGSPNGGEFASKTEGGALEAISDYVKQAFPDVSSFNLHEATEDLEHFIEENFETESTDALDLKQMLTENISGLASSKTRVKAGLNIARQLALEATPSIAKHIAKKGFKFTQKSSLRFPLRKGLAPWMEKEGKWIGKAGSSTRTRIMEPSEDPYQSALNFVRSIRKYQAKQGIISKEIVDNSHKGKHMLRIECGGPSNKNDKIFIMIRHAGDSGSKTPNDQVTIDIKGSLFGNKGKKFKFPEIKGNSQ